MQNLPHDLLLDNDMLPELQEPFSTNVAAIGGVQVGPISTSNAIDHHLNLHQGYNGLGNNSSGMATMHDT